jgi:CpeS-like protein
VDIKEFFELSAGKWFSQKTSHHLTLKQSEHGKSDLVIDILANDDPQVTQLCQQAQCDPRIVWGGVKYTWTGTTHWDAQQQSQANQQGSAIVISVPLHPGSNTGNLVRTAGNSADPPISVTYTMGADNALTLVNQDDLIRSEERIWFESDNVRLRTTIFSQPNGESLAAFYTEIRMSGA